MSAEKIIDRMDDEELQLCWKAIQEGGLGYTQEVNGIPTDEWIEMVYCEVSRRGLTEDPF